ncbi:hypothetical protein D9619_006885 [Psilocybe cf. subviscida]|uniref:Uncharacterized protein n=1 Tax=Psilocybe cf. subviscida TaxID=2480587 RepID=A0A8H5B581_9AGAR|nr:hypothetical protein D9619_006885 [Psilocybe cf. subviscida]
MSPIPPPDQIVAIAFLVALFYGLYPATLFHCMRWLLFTDDGWELRGRKSIPWTKFFLTLAIFSMSTLDRGVQLKRWTEQSMWYHSPTHSQVHTADWTDVVLCTTGNLTSQLADAVLTSRLWNIYNKSYRVIAFPVVLWFGNLVLTALQAYLQIGQVSKLDVWLPVNMSIGPGIILTPFWASTIVLNIYATSMIIYRLWRLDQETTFGRSRRAIRFAASLIIESGSLYLTTGIAHFVVWWTPNNFAINVVSNINIPVIGIAFNLILIRLAQHRADEEHRDQGEPVSAMQFQGVSTEKSINILEADNNVRSSTVTNATRTAQDTFIIQRASISYSLRRPEV